jgi:hypothetical protein
MGVRIVIISGGVDRQIHVGGSKMKRRMICTLLVIVIALSVCSSSLASSVSIMQAQGQCLISNNGKQVTYSGFSDSTINEDVIAVTLRLMELRNDVWYQVDSAYKSLPNANYVQTSDVFTVTGGHYYKVIGMHYSKTGSQAYTIETETTSVWIVG